MSRSMPSFAFFARYARRLADEHRCAGHRREHGVGQRRRRAGGVLVGLELGVAAASPILIVPWPPCTSNVIGTFSTRNDLADQLGEFRHRAAELAGVHGEDRLLLRRRHARRRDRRPPSSCPAGCCRERARSSRSSGRRRRRRRSSRLSKCHATIVSQVPKSGSSPIQQGQSTRQLQTSSKRPSRWYAMEPSVRERWMSRRRHRTECRRAENSTPIPARAPPRISCADGRRSVSAARRPAPPNADARAAGPSPRRRAPARRRAAGTRSASRRRRRGAASGGSSPASA